MNFRIITKKSLIECVEKFCMQYLKEKNQGIFSPPDFKGNILSFKKKNVITVYPFVWHKEGLNYRICRGFIPEFLHTQQKLFLVMIRNCGMSLKIYK